MTRSVLMVTNNVLADKIGGHGRYVRERMRRARAYLHWAAWDGLPLSVPEAISQRAVVIAHDIPPVREILRADQLCQSEEEAAARTKALLEDERTYAKTRNEQLQAVERFLRLAMTRSWQELCARLADRTQRAGSLA